MNSTEDIFNSLKTLLEAHAPPLQLRKTNTSMAEYAGTKEVMQGKQKVQGHYFASLVIKPKDVRFYFFPIYTHVKRFDKLSPELQKFLKGKSCFHVKSLNPKLEQEISELIKLGVSLYQKDNLI